MEIETPSINYARRAEQDPRSVFYPANMAEALRARKQAEAARRVVEGELLPTIVLEHVKGE